MHKTIEITHGVAKNFEIGFYLFTNATSDYGLQFVGTHIRPRIAAPDTWKLPFGLSLSAEIGYQRAQYSTDTWSLEIRPIIDKQFKKLYIAFNPVLPVQLKSDFKQKNPSFAPNLKAAWAFTKKVNFGVEYYGDTGSIKQLESLQNQSHAIFAALDLYFHPAWEINFGTGWGLTKATDGFVFKLILGRHIDWKNKP